MDLLFKKTVLRISFNALVEQLTNELYKEGFVILNSADIKKIFRQHLQVDIKRYVIISVLVPHLANEILQLEPFPGLMLPSEITVTERDERTVEVMVVNVSEFLIGDIDNPSLQNVCEEISRRLNNVLNIVSHKPIGVPDGLV